MANLVFGCGYLGWRVACEWVAAGHDTIAVTRSPDKARRLEEQGIQSLVMDITQPVQLPTNLPFETVLYAVGFDRSPEKTIRDVFVSAFRSVLNSLPGEIERLIHISSTGVYGQSLGEWVDEDSPCDPRRKGGQACLEAERTLLAHHHGPRAIILRLAGIYGPNRIPKLQAVQAGRPITATEGGILNLIHVEDAVRVVLAAEANATPPRTYTVADGNPVKRARFYQEAAQMLGAPPPRFQPPDPNSAAGQRAITSKRVSNARMIRELKVRLRYPSYREGLRALSDAN
jgi:nucleoside-diphosphate-sugar epimerase